MKMGHDARRRRDLDLGWALSIGLAALVVRLIAAWQYAGDPLGRLVVPPTH